MSSYTPGDWTFGGIYVWAGNQPIAKVSINENDQANGALIAAAPDLLAACERSVEYLTDDEEMLAAIAKARGETC